MELQNQVIIKFKYNFGEYDELKVNLKNSETVLQLKERLFTLNSFPKPCLVQLRIDGALLEDNRIVQSYLQKSKSKIIYANMNSQTISLTEDSNKEDNFDNINIDFVIGQITNSLTTKKEVSILDLKNKISFKFGGTVPNINLYLRNEMLKNNMRLRDYVFYNRYLHNPMLIENRTLFISDCAINVEIKPDIVHSNFNPVIRYDKNSSSIVNQYIQEYEEKQKENTIDEDPDYDSELHFSIKEFAKEMQKQEPSQEEKEFDEYIARLYTIPEDSIDSFLQAKISNLAESIFSGCILNDFQSLFSVGEIDNINKSIVEAAQQAAAKIENVEKNSLMKIDSEVNEEIKKVENEVDFLMIYGEASTEIREKRFLFEKTKLFIDYIDNNLVLDNTRKVLSFVFDLDHTLLHSCNIDENEFRRCQNFDPNENPFEKEYSFMIGVQNTRQYFKVKFRSDYFEMIIALKPYIEKIYVSTASIRFYANELVNIINRFILKGHFFINDIVAAEKTRKELCNKNVMVDKQLNHFSDFHSLSKSCLIFDDTINVWRSQTDLGCLIHSYKFLNLSSRTIKNGMCKDLKSGLIINNDHNDIIEFPSPNEERWYDSYFSMFTQSRIYPPHVESKYSQFKQSIYIEQLIKRIIKCRQADSTINTASILSIFRQSVFMGVVFCLEFLGNTEQNEYLEKIINYYGGYSKSKSDQSCTHLIFNSDSREKCMRLADSKRRRNPGQLIYSVNMFWIIQSIYCLTRLNEENDEFKISL